MGHYLRVRSVKLLVALGTRKKTLQNMTKILNLFYLMMCLEESNIYAEHSFFTATEMHRFVQVSHA